MSCSPTTRLACDTPLRVSLKEIPLPEGSLVLESIARQEAMRALLAFSDFQGEIRSSRSVAGQDFDRDLRETERFILDEVLQLICDRAQAITKADGILVALAQSSEPKQVEMVCRAAAGGRGVPCGRADLSQPGSTTPNRRQIEEMPSSGQVQVLPWARRSRSACVKSVRP